MSKLAINGGKKVFEQPLKGRYNIGLEEKAAVCELFDNAISSGNAFGYNGPKEEEFCNKFASLMGGGYADGVNSGTNAVYVALRSLEIEAGSEVIVSPITDPGGIMPITLCGLKPVTADCEENSYNISTQSIKEKITPKTKAIIVAHIMGEPADMVEIMRIAKEHGLKVLEDCAQAHLSQINGQNVGTFGDVASFSTMFGKHFNTGGQGGVVYTTSEDTYWKIRQYADRGKPFGLEDGATNIVPAINCNMDELGATIGIVQLDKLEALVDKRRELVDYLRKSLKSVKAVSVPEYKDEIKPSFWFVRMNFNEGVLTCSKSDYLDAVIEEGLKITKSYNFAIPARFDWYKKIYKEEIDIPNVDKICEKCFNLTVFESWSKVEIDLIVKAFKKVEDEYIK